MFGPWGLWSGTLGAYPFPPGAMGAMPGGPFPCALGGTGCLGCWSVGAALFAPAYLAALADPVDGYCGTGLAEIPTAASTSGVLR